MPDLMFENKKNLHIFIGGGCGDKHTDYGQKMFLHDLPRCG